MPHTLYHDVYGAVRARIAYLRSVAFGSPNICFLTSNLAFGGVSGLPALASLGITAVLDLRKEGRSLEREASSLSLEYLKVDVEDGLAPQDLHSLAEWVDRKVKAGQKVFVHCKLGRGRAPTVVCAYLMLKKGLSVSQAIALIKKKRPYIRFTDSQRAALQRYAESRFPS